MAGEAASVSSFVPYIYDPTPLLQLRGKRKNDITRNYYAKSIRN